MDLSIDFNNNNTGTVVSGSLVNNNNKKSLKRKITTNNNNDWEGQSLVMSFNNIQPSAILSMIYQYFEILEICIYSRICKHWHNFGANSKLAYKGRYIELESDDQHRWFFSKLDTELFGLVEVLILFYRYKMRYDSCNYTLLDHMPRLNRLAICNEQNNVLNDEQTFYFSDSIITTLKDLTIKSYKRPIILNVFNTPNIFQRLEKLEINEIDLLQLINDDFILFPVLTYIKLEPNNVDNHDITQVMSQIQNSMPNITTFECKYTITWLKRHSDKWPYLQDLTFNSDTQIMDKLPSSIKHLYWNNSDIFPIENCLEIEFIHVSNGQSLRQLPLEYMNKITHWQIEDWYSWSWYFNPNLNNNSYIIQPETSFIQFRNQFQRYSRIKLQELIIMKPCHDAVAHNLYHYVLNMFECINIEYMLSYDIICWNINKTESLISFKTLKCTLEQSLKDSVMDRLKRYFTWETICISSA